MYTVVTTRFNKETLIKNYEYRAKHGLKCMYCCPSEMSPKIHYNSPVFVIEMNNSINKIEGIGLIKNKPETKKYYKVHSDGNTNRYTYIGEYYIEREIIDDYNSPLLYALEEILFKGKTHSKRGSGLSTTTIGNNAALEINAATTLTIPVVKMLPAVTLPLELRLVRIPTLVILGCALAVTVPALPALTA